MSQKIDFQIITLPNTAPENFDATNALILSRSKEFSSKMMAVRRDLSLKTRNDFVEKFLENGAHRGPSLLEAKLTKNLDREVLLNKAKEITSSYRLGDRWLDSIVVAFLCDYLVLPFYGMIKVKFNGISATDVYQDSDGNPIEVYRLGDTGKLEIKISLKERISVTSLATYVQNNKEIKLALDALPETTKTRSKVNSPIMQWGYQVWLYKQSINAEASFQSIYEYLDENSEDIVPIATELAGHYKRYLSYIKRLSVI